MSFFQPVELIRKRKKINETNDYLFDFKILKTRDENASIKSISICSKYVAISYNNTIILNNIKGESLDKKYQCKENVSKLKFRDDKMLGVGLENGDIELIGMFCFDRIKKLEGHKSTINDLIFSANFQNLYSCSRDFTIKIWNIWKGICEYSLDYHIDNVTSICLYNFDNNINYLISSSYDGYVYLYDLSLNKCLNKLELIEPVDYLYIFKNEYLVLSIKNIIKIYNLENLEFIKDIIVSTKTIFYINIFKNFLVAASLDKSIYFIDPFHKNLQNIKIVSIANFIKSPKSIDVFNDILVLGELEGSWFIEVYNEKEKNKKAKNQHNNSINNFEMERYVYTDNKINNLVKKFKYRDALMNIINNDPQSTLSLLDYFSKHKVLVAACRTYSIQEALKILTFFRKKFVIDILMFEFFFSFFSANKWIITTKNTKVLEELQLLKREFENVKNSMKYYHSLKEIADNLKK
ncbi:conserved Plasmodium protein, unknown function [Plasmodium gallinaceum]|uniref:Uncharacterized protein n=1 Tax=Plasmodium gallinaceum TaxID=5849 RepID=A0A1J1GW35_PLAGA|nr:conserved Plasmodium protein, unknown function [Plasmodium gallinaceum]CRG95228.1 conserved Plasmodium protein, unknown function [Plasmodium gallinaceum]